MKHYEKLARAWNASAKAQRGNSWVNREERAEQVRGAVRNIGFRGDPTSDGGGTVTVAPGVTLRVRRLHVESASEGPAPRYQNPATVKPKMPPVTAALRHTLEIARKDGYRLPVQKYVSAGHERAEAVRQWKRDERFNAMWGGDDE